MRNRLFKSSTAIIIVVALATLPMSIAHASGFAGGVVKSTVNSAASGRPLSGVAVRIIDLETARVITEKKSSEEGTVDFSDVPYGLYQVSVLAPADYAGAAGPLVLLNEDNPDATVSFALEPVPTAPAPAQGTGLSLAAWLAILGGTAAVIATTVKLASDDKTQ